MRFNLSKTDIESIIELIDKYALNNSKLCHVKNVIMNRRGSKQYTKKELIELVLSIDPDYNKEKLQDMDDKKLYSLILLLEERKEE